jgi:hypothetical protein
MNLPRDCFLDYVITKEAYYAHVTRAHSDPEIWIRASAREGGVAWEFSAVQVGNIGVKLDVFDDAWQAFNDLPEFFQSLAARGKGVTLDDVRETLDRLGAVDSTQRVDPDTAIKRRAAFGDVA